MVLLRLRSLRKKKKKKTHPSNLLFGESIKMVTFLIIAQREITARLASGCFYGNSALRLHKATWADFVSSVK